MIKFIDIMALLGYCAAIFWLSHKPSLPVPMLFEHQDKLHHITAYFVMGILAWRNFRHYILSPYNLVTGSIVFCSLYGISDEWHQSFVPGRTADAIDWLADTVGASAAVLPMSYFANKINSLISGKAL